MKIVEINPPNIGEILAAFPFANRHGVFFTYGDTIFNPSGVDIPPELRCHESVHAQRQEQAEGGVEGWWKRYLVDVPFRAEEELLAHRAEYRAFKGMVKDPKRVARQLNDIIAARLCGPLYGGLMSHATARRLIVVDVDPRTVARTRREQGATA